MVATYMADEALVSASSEREAALVARMTQRGERFHVVTLGFKCEYDHEELVWLEAGRWLIEWRDGCLKTSARREVTQQQALAQRRAHSARREGRPEHVMASLQAQRPEPRAGEAGS